MKHSNVNSGLFWATVSILAAKSPESHQKVMLPIEQ